ncbi:MAG TPA: hypothetical protein VFO20_03425 [Propionibacteriaceae bacterium]|nr:hypothetical protein [Propionibacteriaceae bacterium]
MRFSIVFDDNGAILAASVDGEETDRPKTQLNQIVERTLVDLDARQLEQSPDPKEADDCEST